MMFGHDRRFGLVHISRALLEQEPAIIANVVFKDCVIMRAEFEAMNESITYGFYSPDIPAVPPGAKVPTYIAQVKKQANDEGEVVSISRTWVQSEDYARTVNGQ